MSETNAPAVIVDYATARIPVSGYAQMLAAAAAVHAGETNIKNLADGRQDTFRVNPYLLNIRGGWNVRRLNTPENQTHIDMLARQIAAKDDKGKPVGVLEPLTVVMENGRLDVTDGHCRTMAAYRAIEVYGAEIDTVPVKMEPRGASKADQKFSQITRNSGKGLTRLERGENFISMIEEFGWSEDKVVSRSGMQKHVVIADMCLAKAPEELREMIYTGKLSASQAIESIAEFGETEALRVFTEASKLVEDGKKITARTIASVVTQTPVAPITRPRRAAAAAAGNSGEAAAKRTPTAFEAMMGKLIDTLDALIPLIPEYDTEEHMTLDRAYKNAVTVLAEAEALRDGVKTRD